MYGHTICGGYLLTLLGPAHQIAVIREGEPLNVFHQLLVNVLQAEESKQCPHQSCTHCLSCITFLTWEVCSLQLSH